MKRRRFLILLLIFLCSMFVFSACKAEPYKDYASTGLEAKRIPFNYEDDYLKPYDKFGYGKAEIFTDYDSYSAYNFNLDYTKSYFESNDLLVFVISCCSSDETEFGGNT